MTGKDDIEIDLEGEEEVVVDLEGGEEAEEKKEPKPRIRLQDKVEDAGEVEDPVAVATKALEEAKAKAERDLAASAATAASERQARIAAEQLAQRYAKDADAARAETETAQLTLLERGIEASTGEVESLQGALENAYEASDFKKVAEIQTKLSRASATLDRLEAAKEDLATAPKKPPTTEGRVETPPQQGSAFEQYLSQFAPEAQTWLRAHPECAPANVGGNGQSNSKMMAGHYAALAQNVQPNTPEYFRIIEENTGHRQPVSAAADIKPAEVTPSPSKKPVVAAPPSREVPRADGKPGRTNPRSITLSKDQQDMAKVSFPHLPQKEAFAQYARNLIELESEGKMGRLTH